MDTHSDDEDIFVKKKKRKQKKGNLGTVVKDEEEDDLLDGNFFDKFMDAGFINEILELECLVAMNLT